MPSKNIKITVVSSFIYILTGIFITFLKAYPTLPPGSTAKQPESRLIPEKSDLDANLLARLFAALPLNNDHYSYLETDPQVKIHYSEFTKGWQNLEDKRLKKMRRWRDKELSDLNQQNSTLFYAFSGPDFLNAYELFPDCAHYLLFGLEKTGEIPELKNFKGKYLGAYLAQLRQSLSEIFQRNYFITGRMSNSLNSDIKGVLPLFYVFLVRTGNEIVKLEKVVLDKKGGYSFMGWKEQASQNQRWGIHIEFKNPALNFPQHLYYFAADLSDVALANYPGLIPFIKSFQNKVNLTKSASYLLHTSHFNLIRNLILTDTFASVQDDTGVPYNYFKQADWEVRLYGKYAPPIRDFNYGYQADLDQAFRTLPGIQSIDFTFGYHWWTDKSSILVCTKNKYNR